MNYNLDVIFLQQEFQLTHDELKIDTKNENHAIYLAYCT